MCLEAEDGVAHPEEECAEYRGFDRCFPGSEQEFPSDHHTGHPERHDERILLDTRFEECSLECDQDPCDDRSENESKEVLVAIFVPVPPTLIKESERTDGKEDKEGAIHGTASLQRCE